MRVCAGDFHGRHWRGLLTALFFVTCLGSSGFSAGTTERARPQSANAYSVREFYLRFVDRIEIHGLHVDWESELPAYFSSGMECEDFRDLSLERLAGGAAQGGDSGVATISLLRGRGVSIVNSTALPRTGTFLQASR